MVASSPTRPQVVARLLRMLQPPGQRWLTASQRRMASTSHPRRPTGCRIRGHLEGPFFLGLALARNAPTGIGRRPSTIYGRTNTRPSSSSRPLARARKSLPAANGSSTSTPFVHASRRPPARRPLAQLNVFFTSEPSSKGSLPRGTWSTRPRRSARGPGGNGAVGERESLWHNTLYSGGDVLVLAACTAVTAPCRTPLPRTSPTALGGGKSIRSDRSHQCSVANAVTSRLAVDNNSAPPPDDHRPHRRRRTCRSFRCDHRTRRPARRCPSRRPWPEQNL
jgi:hypothetical protein